MAHGLNRSHDLNTIIFSTHDIELAAELADSIYVIGYPTLENGVGSYGTVIKNFDLKAMGLAWQNELTPQHLEVVKDIKASLLAS